MRRRVASLAAATFTLALLVPVASVSAASAISVYPGQSIQAAINRAPSGGLVVVEPGTYRGNLEIKRSVRLVGHEAVIVPAAKSTKNGCSVLLPGVGGICAHGVISADGSSITKVLSNVSIEGFTVQGFGGAGIVAEGVDGFRAVRNVTAHNGLWGIEVGESSGVTLLYNTAYANGSDGIHVDYSPSGNAVILGNSSYGNLGTGILVVSALGGRIALNTTSGNCAGIIVAATGGDPANPADGLSGNVSIQLNQVTANNRFCPAVADQGTPAYGGVGIALIGAQNTIVALNDVEGNVSQTGSSITGGGVLMLDGAMFGAAAPTGNSIRLNSLSGNLPNDISGDGSGTGNIVSGNSCTTTSLTGAC